MNVSHIYRNNRYRSNRTKLSRATVIKTKGHQFMKPTVLCSNHTMVITFATPWE